MAQQDKAAEVAFFQQFDDDDYRAFTDETNERLISQCIQIGGFQAGDRVGDMGCGTGTFTHLLHTHGMKTVGVDITEPMVELARELYPNIEFLTGDVEGLPLPDDSFDGLILSGIVHHFPDPTCFAQEIFRVLKPGGRFVAFDPNRQNPFVYLYRDKQSPFYSPVGVTPNENPVSAAQMTSFFSQMGFEVKTDYISMSYRFVKSDLMQKLLPLYNLSERLLFMPSFMRRHRTLLLTVGKKI